MNSLKKSYLIMKIVAGLLIFAVSALIYIDSSLHHDEGNSYRTSTTQDLRLLNDRPSPPNLLWKENNKTHSLSLFKGQITYINFWAEWCAPCKAELPIINELQLQFKDQVQFLLMYADEANDLEKAKGFANKLAPDLKKFYQTQSLRQAMAVEVLPYHIILDKNGKIAARFYADLTEEKEAMTKLLLELIAEN